MLNFGLIKLASKLLKSKKVETNNNNTPEMTQEANIAGKVIDAVKPLLVNQKTKRLELDANGDNKLSKNIRPVVMIWLLSLVTIAIVAHFYGFELPTEYKDLLFWGVVSCIGFYFPGRDAIKFFKEKSQQRKDELKHEYKIVKNEQKRN